ncbi:MAG TPA: Sua5/YciO/YrdC/YwlC family protein [Tepidisphaeraceae bacterium]|nr:Sua5/YciO/YrdC/YwlC family protein [Tepidisphaeraceae bacterium]
MTTSVVEIFSAGDYPTQIHRSAGVLRDGGLVVLPTETVYGVAAMASHPDAIRKLRALRNAGEQPLTIHLADSSAAIDLVGEPTPFAKRLMKKLWPGPVGLTFSVDPSQRARAAGKLELREADVFDASGNITLRCPHHTVAIDVIRAVAAPVVLAVAGTDGGGAREVSKIAPALEGKVDLILDAGPTPFAKPSTLIQVGPDGYKIVREGIYDQRIIERLMRTTVLFVCSGNTCRSPMAEAIARKVIADRLKVPQDEIESSGYSVLSAGASAFPGGRATPEAVDAVRKLGGDLSKHRSKPLMPELINQADLILTMSNAHRQAVLAINPAAASKVSTLDPNSDIEDPIGGDRSLYEELAGTLQGLISTRVSDLVPSR